MPQRNCPKCQGSMTEGFEVDHGHNGQRTVGSWVEGAPERGFFGLKVRNKKKFEIQTWRCGRCGFLESYAN